MAQKGPQLNDLDELEQRDNPQARDAPDWMGKLRKHLLPTAIGGGVILLVLILILFATGSGDERKAAENQNETENVEARLNKLEFQHRMVLENVNKMQESSGVRQKELAKLRKAVSDLEKRLASLEDRLVNRQDAGGETQAGGESRSGARWHTVEKGETLFRISQRYDVSVEQLREWNDLGKEEYIQPGQELQVAP
ncbi:MAG: LysM domain-containing protein [Desulfohalobiaceae bacterium]